jgi:16S rRNA (guanine527-N7)-methyltransferase
MMTKVDSYISLLLKWNKKINLIGSSTESNIIQRHIYDCEKILPYLGDKNQAIIDIGSGAGLPGIVIALAGYKNVHLVESDHRKCAFLRFVNAELDLKLTVHSERIEHIDIQGDVFVSRACASLKQLYEWAYPLSHKKTQYAFLKSDQIKKELEDLQKICHTSISMKNGVVYWEACFS